MQTPGTAFLKAQGVSFTEHTYEYVEHGGTEVPAQALGVPEHTIVKTLVTVSYTHLTLPTKA